MKLSDIADVWQDEVIWTNRRGGYTTKPKKELQPGDAIIVRIGGRVFQYDPSMELEDLPRNFIGVRIKPKYENRFDPQYVAQQLERKIKYPIRQKGKRWLDVPLRGSVQQSVRVNWVRGVDVEGNLSLDEQKQSAKRIAGLRDAGLKARLVAERAEAYAEDQLKQQAYLRKLTDSELNEWLDNSLKKENSRDIPLAKKGFDIVAKADIIVQDKEIWLDGEGNEIGSRYENPYYGDVRTKGKTEGDPDEKQEDLFIGQNITFLDNQDQRLSNEGQIYNPGNSASTVGGGGQRVDVDIPLRMRIQEIYEDDYTGSLRKKGESAISSKKQITDNSNELIENSWRSADWFKINQNQDELEELEKAIPAILQAIEKGSYNLDDYSLEKHLPYSDVEGNYWHDTEEGREWALGLSGAERKGKFDVGSPQHIALLASLQTKLAQRDAIYANNGVNDGIVYVGNEYSSKAFFDKGLVTPPPAFFLNTKGAEMAKLRWDNKKRRWVADKRFNQASTFDKMVRENEKRSKDLMKPGRSPLRTRLFETQTKKKKTYTPYTIKAITDPNLGYAERKRVAKNYADELRSVKFPKGSYAEGVKVRARVVNFKDYDAVYVNLDYKDAVDEKLAEIKPIGVKMGTKDAIQGRNIRLQRGKKENIESFMARGNAILAGFEIPDFNYPKTKTDPLEMGTRLVSSWESAGLTKAGKKKYPLSNFPAKRRILLDGKKKPKIFPIYMKRKQIADVEFTSSNLDSKKMKAVFTFDDGSKKTTHFGGEGYSDYTLHKDAKRKINYLKRHQVNENWNDPTSAGALSRYILWNKTTKSASIKDYKKRFNI